MAARGGPADGLSLGLRRGEESCPRSPYPSLRFAGGCGILPSEVRCSAWCARADPPNWRPLLAHSRVGGLTCPGAQELGVLHGG